MKTPQEQAKLAAVRLTWLAVTTVLALIALAIFWFKTQNAKEVTEVTPTEPTATAPLESLSALTSKLNALTAKRDLLLKNFVQTGDKFKHPKVYSRNHIRYGTLYSNESAYLLSATSDGYLHSRNALTITFNANGEMFRIRFTHASNQYYGLKIDSRDIADGYIAISALEQRDKALFKGLREFCDFILSDSGKTLKVLHAKIDDNSKSELDEERIRGLRDTIELFVVLEEIEKISKEIRAR